MRDIFSNTNQKKDFLEVEMNKYSHNNEVLIAVAFFTHERFIKKLIEHGCTVKLIVRLGFPTDPLSLEKILKMKNIMVRFFTSRTFHPKLYIYGNDIAFLGSSNLTDGGLMSNQELNISIDSENETFEDLQEVFYQYWEEAQVLDSETLQKYKILVGNLSKEYKNVEKKILNDIGEITPPNDIKIIDKKRKDKVKEYELSLMKRYQEYLIKFEELKKTYKSLRRRKVSESSLPLRIEIHRFLNWVRKTKAYKDLYLMAPERNGHELLNFVREHIHEFMDNYVEDFQSQINDYKIINSNLSSEQRIKALSEDELLRTLKIVTAFREHIKRSTNMDYQYEFLEKNGIDKIKNTLIYLLFGADNYVKRIANCIYNPEYSLSHFGKSCIQETYGWVNNEEVPICNERAYKSMRWLGYGDFR